MGHIFTNKITEILNLLLLAGDIYSFYSSSNRTMILGANSVTNSVGLNSENFLAISVTNFLSSSQ